MITHGPYVKWPNNRTLVFGGEFISLSVISKMTGLDRFNLHRIFRGRRTPSTDSTRRISKALNIPPSMFLRKLRAHLWARKNYRDLPLVIPYKIREQIDNEAEALYNQPMHPDIYIVSNPNKKTVQFAGRFINLSAISRVSKIDTGYLSRVFSGSRIPSIKNAQRIAGLLGMGLESFLHELDKRVKEVEDQKAQCV